MCVYSPVCVYACFVNAHMQLYECVYVCAKCSLSLEQAFEEEDFDNPDIG